MKPNRLTIPAIVFALAVLAGCGSVCQDLQAARTTFNFSLDAIHVAHDLHQVTAEQEAKMLPYLTAAAKAMEDGDSVCIAEQVAVAAGDKTAASGFAAQAKVFLKVALSALDSYYTLAPPPVKAIAAAKKSAPAAPTTKPGGP